MTSVVLIGGGRMGSLVRARLEEVGGFELLGTYDASNAAELDGAAPAADLAIDFSSKAALPHVLAYVRRTGAALLSGTTGFSDAELDELRALGKATRVVHSANYSLGVAVLRRMLRDYAPVLRDWDKELVETHHNQKADAPSGTAHMLFDAIRQVRPNAVEHCGRSGEGKRTPEEIGVSSLRMGGIVGMHEVHICTGSQMLTLRHDTLTRSMLAEGGVAAARFLLGKPAGLYNMESILEAW